MSINRVKILAKTNGGNMVVKCISSFRHQVIAGKIYLVVEILVKRYNAKISYRIIDEEGYPAIYDEELFDIVSNSLHDYSVISTQESLILSPAQIVNSELNKKMWRDFGESLSKTIRKRMIC